MRSFYLQSLGFLLLTLLLLTSTQVADSRNKSTHELATQNIRLSSGKDEIPKDRPVGTFLQSLLDTFHQTNPQNELWRDAQPQEAATIRQNEKGGPRNFRPLTLNLEVLEAKLLQAPKESSETAANKVTLSLPVPDGSFMNFDFQESSIMEEALAQRYPEIKTYRGQGIDDPTAITRFDWTPQGFHAIILSTRGTILIEPETQGHGANYIAYFQSEMPKGSGECDTQDSGEGPKLDLSMRPSAVSGSALRSYRLAVAATAEYTATYGGGTVPGGLAAITTTINLVDAIYEREVAIRLVLVANEDSIIFTDTATDGYTSDNQNAMFNENQTKLDAVIGDANYDIGHVFDGRTLAGGSFSWRGVAAIGSVCRSVLKGRGVSITRSINPANLYAYYSTAHEMGHQFGASHTFNATTGDC
ncbi:MAG TPA: zinc-dependent metalloprotease family protein, partial [Pyrinomonadaceae bacterium]|nr:zinc-dependent metalloprotease family protein [Pyrinomonadaceae bacterium]